MSDEKDIEETLLRLQPSEPNSRPKQAQEVFDLEIASKVAARYRELNVGKASIFTDEDETYVSLLLPPLFARQLIDLYLMHKAGDILKNKNSDVIYERSSDDKVIYGSEYDE